jgi:hypothetical protein
MLHALPNTVSKFNLRFNNTAYTKLLGPMAEPPEHGIEISGFTDGGIS